MATTTRKPKPKPTLDQIISSATPAERVVHVCVAGGMVAEYQELERELQAAHEHDLASNKLNSGSTARPIAQRMEKLAEKMREHTYAFRFRALSAKEWSDLTSSHPGRDGKRETFNTETLPPALIAACCVEPDGMSDEAEVKRLLEVLNPAQRADLFDGAWEVNNEAVSVPFSATASAVLRGSEQSSTTAAPEASPGRSSSDGQ